MRGDLWVKKDEGICFSAGSDGEGFGIELLWFICWEYASLAGAEIILPLTFFVMFPDPSDTVVLFNRSLRACLNFSIWLRIFLWILSYCDNSYTVLLLVGSSDLFKKVLKKVPNLRAI